MVSFASLGQIISFLPNCCPSAEDRNGGEAGGGPGGAEHSCAWHSHPADELLDKLPRTTTAAATALGFPRDRGARRGQPGASCTWASSAAASSHLECRAKAAGGAGRRAPALGPALRSPSKGKIKHPVSGTKRDGALLVRQKRTPEGRSC